MATTQKVNKFIKINADDDFKQYAWVLENYDTKAAFTDFLNIEQGIQTKGNEDILNELYKQFLESKSSDHMTQLQFDVLNYILKYESGVYKKGEIIADIVDEENGDGHFQINEPGYYYIEVTGNSGKSSGVFKNYMSNGTASTKFVGNDENTQNELYVSNDLKFNLFIQDRNKIRRIGGYIELNKKYVFFYNSIDDNDFDTKKDRSDFSDISLEQSNFNFYDYASVNDDIFSKDFFKITFVENGFTFKRFDAQFDYIEYTCGLDENDRKIALSKIDKESCKHYYNIIDQNAQQNNCKVLGYSNVILTDKSTDRKKVLHKNELHGGDGGFINSVIKINKPMDFQYSLNKGSSKNYLKCDYFEMIAEAGGSLDANLDKYHFSDVDSYNDVKLYDDIGGHRSSNQDDLSSEPVNFHVGESIDHNVLCGCGRGIYKDKDGNVKHVFYGGGEYGEGIRLNEFGTAYYQESNIGHIRIKYLGSQYCKTSKFNYDSDRTYKENVSLYTNENIPVSENIDIKLNLCKMVGCFDSDGIKDIIEPISRKLNYINISLITEKVDGTKTYNFKNKEDKKYVSFEPLTEEYSYVNKDNTNECDFNSIVFGTGDSIDLKAIMKNSSECFDMSFIYAYNHIMNKTLNMQILSFKNSVLNMNFSNISGNLKIFRKYSEILSISFLLKNTLNLPQIMDVFGDITHKPCENAGISKILYTTDYENEEKVYSDGQILYVNKGTKFTLKFIFNTPRIAIDENTSSFSGKVTYLKKNLSTNGENVLDNYFNPTGKEDDNFQYVIFYPSFSQDVSVFIKKYTFSIKLLQDLHRNIIVNNNSLKNEFEVGECCELSFNLHNYERISHLIAKTDDSILYNYPPLTENSVSPCYAYVDNKNIYESFLSFYGSEDSEGVPFNFCDKKINAMLNRKNCYGKKDIDKTDEYYNGLFVVGTRKFDNNYYSDFEDCGQQVNIMCITSSKNLINELITLRIYFKESNMKLRLTSNYCNGEEVFIYENGESGTISFFKPYKFVLEIVGGPTGNGENASVAKESGWMAAKMGYFGGDGYTGGNGGASSDTSYWGPGKDGWKFAITNLSIKCSWGVEEPYGGRGFIKCGGMGSEGENTLTHNQQCLFKEHNNPKAYTSKCNWYVGIPIVREIRIYKTIEDFKPITFYFKAGVQGLNLVNAFSNGRGGGAGLPSFFTAISSQSFFDSKRNFFKYDNDTNGDFPHMYDYGQSCPTIKKSTGFIVEGGITGVSRGCNTQKVEYTNAIWNLNNFTKIEKYDVEDRWKYYDPYKVVNGTKDDTIETFDTFYSISNNDDLLGKDRLLGSQCGDFDGHQTTSLFSATGYGSSGEQSNFQKKFSSIDAYDKYYMFLVERDNGLKFKFKNDTCVVTNTANEFMNGIESYDRENTVSERYLSKDYFLGKAYYSYENGIVKLTAHNDISVDNEEETKLSYESFLEGNCESYCLAPYFKKSMTQQQLLEQAALQK